MFCCQHQVEAFDAVRVQDRRLLKFSAYSAFVITFLLVICRLSAFFSSKSLAVEASLYDAIKDFFVSSVNAFLILRSVRPANPSFPFGYGKVEALAALFQSAFLLITGSLIVFDAIQGAVAHDHSVMCTSIALTSLVISIALALILALVQSYVAHRTKSMAVLADSIHYRTDVFMNIGIVFCFLISVKSSVFDITIGVFLAIYLIFSAWNIGRHAVFTLLDHSLPSAVVQNILNIVVAAEGTVTSLRTHSSGRGEFVVLQLAEDPSLTLEQFAEKQLLIERKIHEQFPRSFVFIGSCHEFSARLSGRVKIK